MIMIIDHAQIYYQWRLGAKCVANDLNITHINKQMQQSPTIW